MSSYKNLCFNCKHYHYSEGPFVGACGEQVDSDYRTCPCSDYVPVPTLYCYEFRYEDNAWRIFDTDGKVYVANKEGQKVGYEKFEDALFHIKFTHPKIEESSEENSLSKASKLSCPCQLTGNWCSLSCTCVNPLMSGGCVYCPKYGSLERRKTHAQNIIDAVKFYLNYKSSDEGIL